MNRTDYIKRLVGMPGDRVQMRQGLLYLNGEPVQRRQVELVNETGDGLTARVLQLTAMITVLSLAPSIIIMPGSAMCM